ncbi:MAG: hypothetical protein DDT20_01895 [Firmicutes bacterium]|nr:hypothetical protein [Bacillota bacterium]
MEELFKAAYPKAVDFPKSDYSNEMVRIAARHGYRYAGERLGRAVFTTKALDTPPVRARNPDGTYRGDDPATPENEAWI